MSHRIGIRRWGDRCFHEVEEVLDDGYIVGGFFIRKDEVVAVRTWDDDAGPPACADDDSNAITDA